MKVLYLIDTLQVGGSEKSLLEIASAFRSVEPVMVPVYPGRGATLHAEYRARGVRVIPLEVQGKYAFPTAIARFGRVLARERPDLVHTTLFRSDVIGRLAARAYRLPVVSSFVNDNYADIHFARLSRLGWIKHRGLQTIDLATTPLVTRFFANSETMKRSNARALFLDEAKIDVIYRGRNVDLYTRTRADTRDPHAPLILNVARLLPRKGQETLIRAMPAVRARHARAELWIAGEGPHRGPLERVIAELGLGEVVKLLGTRSDVPALLERADVFINTSEYEGHPGAVVEAMLSGTPAVLSDIAVHREMGIDRETAFFFALGDAESLARALNLMLEDPLRARAIGERAQRSAIERFDVRAIAARHEALYASILAGWKNERSGGENVRHLGPRSGADGEKAAAGVQRLR